MNISLLYTFTLTGPTVITALLPEFGDPYKQSILIIFYQTSETYLFPFDQIFYGQLQRFFELVSYIT